jgi:hypothetical protein
MQQQDLETKIGSRGHSFVKSHNRSFVRQWLVSRGIPAKVANIQPNWILGSVYNDRLDTKFNELAMGTLEGMKKPGETGAADIDRETIESANETTETTEAARDTIEAAVQVNHSGSNPGEKLGAVLQEILQNGAVNAQQVRALVNKQLDTFLATLPALIAEHSGFVRIELKNGTETVKFEGAAHPMFATLLKIMSSRMPNGFHPNIMLVGPTGSGKTHAVGEAAKLLDMEFFTNGAITMDHQLIGFKDAAGNYHKTPLRDAFGKRAVYLFDEIDSSDNSPLLCLSGALANGAFAFPDAFVHRHPDSIIIAAGNTFGNGATSEFVGRNKLDGAVRSRFPVRLFWGYDEKLERAISGNVDWAIRVQKARANANRAGLKVIIDPRMSQAGAALIAAGMTEQEAAEVTYLADLSPEQRNLVEAA